MPTKKRGYNRIIGSFFANNHDVSLIEILNLLVKVIILYDDQVISELTWVL
jgi:hypothetical protein